MAALPGAAPAVLLLDELLRLRERQAQVEQPLAPSSGINFVCDTNGSVSRTQITTMVLAQSVQGQVLGTMASTVLTVTDAATSVADATAQAASRAGTAALNAATRVAVSTRDAVASMGRQLSNADRIAELRTQATDLAAFQGGKEWLDLMRALFAVGIAMAAADGEISESERYAIEEFVGGAGYSKLPAALKADIRTWMVNPPTINQAFEMASRCDEDGMHQIENVLEVITNSDDVVHPAELAFRAQWQAMRQAAIE